MKHNLTLFFYLVALLCGTVIIIVSIGSHFDAKLDNYNNCLKDDLGKSRVMADYFGLSLEEYCDKEVEFGEINSASNN